MPTHGGVFRTTDHRIPFCPGPSRVKNAQVILASGRVSLYTGQPHLETSRHLDRSLQIYISDNFKTKSNLKTNYPISEVEKNRLRSENCLAGSCTWTDRLVQNPSSSPSPAWLPAVVSVRGEDSSLKADSCCHAVHMRRFSPLLNNYLMI